MIKDLVLYIAVYVSPEQSPIYNSYIEKNGISLLESNIVLIKSHFSDCYIYLAGYLNARCKDMLDFIPDDRLDHIFLEQIL